MSTTILHHFDAEEEIKAQASLVEVDGSCCLRIKTFEDSFHLFMPTWDAAEKVIMELLADIRLQRAASEMQGSKCSPTMADSKVDSPQEAPAVCSEAGCDSTDGVRKTEYGLLCICCREDRAKDHEPIEAQALGLID